MQEIYYWTGFVFFWLMAIIGCLAMLIVLYTSIFNWISRNYKSLWIIVEFQFYRKQFKEWVKDQPRHKNMSDGGEKN